MRLPINLRKAVGEALTKVDKMLEDDEARSVFVDQLVKEGPTGDNFSMLMELSSLGAIEQHLGYIHQAMTRRR